MFRYRQIVLGDQNVRSHLLHASALTMTHLSNGVTEAVPFSSQSLKRVRIVDLSPTLDAGETYYILGDVALIWPYSSSSRRLSVLVAERDAQLRKSRGQVKITFIGPCAEEVATARLGIGDGVELALEGSTWVQMGEAVPTPGKQLPWDLHYENRVILGIQRKEGPSTVVDFVREDLTQEHSLIGDASRRASGHSGGLTNGYPIEISSPAFIQSKRFSAGSFLDASLDPFAEDDGFVRGKGRKRTKFSRPSAAWRLLDDSNGQQDDAVNYEVQGEDAIVELCETTADVVLIDKDSGQTLLQTASGEEPPHTIVATDVEATDLVPPNQEEIEFSSLPESSSKHVDTEVLADSATMPLPITPLQHSQPRQLQRIPALEVVTESSSQQLVTPRLHPLASPELPLVSPLIHQSAAATDLVRQATATESELDAGSGDGPDETSVHLAAGMEQLSPDIVSLISPDGCTVPVSSFMLHDDNTASIPASEEYSTRNAAGLDMVDQQTVPLEDDDMYGPISHLPASDQTHSPSTISPDLTADDSAGPLQHVNGPQQVAEDLRSTTSVASSLEEGDEEEDIASTTEPELEDQHSPLVSENWYEHQKKARMSRAQSLDGAIDDQPQSFVEKSLHAAVSSGVSTEPEAVTLRQTPRPATTMPVAENVSKMVEIEAHNVES